MVDISSYLHQKCVLKHPEYNEYNEINSSVDNTIYIRQQKVNDMVYNKDGVMILSNSKCFSKILVNVDDVIVINNIDYIVVNVSDIFDRNGIINHYEFYLI